MTDLSGTLIESSVPIAAFSGNDCNKLNNIGACDHLIEQLPPTDSIDKQYIVPPNSNDRDTLIRITAIENANISFMIGGVFQTRSLNKFDFLTPLYPTVRHVLLNRIHLFSYSVWLTFEKFINGRSIYNNRAGIQPIS